MTTFGSFNSSTQTGSGVWPWQVEADSWFKAWQLLLTSSELPVGPNEPINRDTPRQSSQGRLAAAAILASQPCLASRVVPVIGDVRLHDQRSGA